MVTLKRLIVGYRLCIFLFVTVSPCSLPYTTTIVSNGNTIKWYLVYSIRYCYNICRIMKKRTFNICFSLLANIKRARYMSSNGWISLFLVCQYSLINPFHLISIIIYEYIFKYTPKNSQIFDFYFRITFLNVFSPDIPTAKCIFS